MGGSSSARPGWGEYGSHPSIPYVPWDQQGKQFKGGTEGPAGYASKSEEDASLRDVSPENGMWMTMKGPGVREKDVSADEQRGNGMDFAKEPALYQAPADIDWKRKPGEIEVVETDRTSGIASINMSDSHKWTALQGALTKASGHPDIQLNSPETSLRVQMYDMETGQINWDSIYFLRKPGKIDSKTKEWGSSDGLVGMLKDPSKRPDMPHDGWKSFQRLSIPKDDPTTHHYELRITKYPPSRARPGYEGDIDEVQANTVGTAHFRVQVVDDPTPPSESSARIDAAALGGTISYKRMPEVLLAASPADMRPANLGATANISNLGAWRRQRHREFWSKSPSSATLRPSRSKPTSRADQFFALPAEGQPSLITR